MLRRREKSGANCVSCFRCRDEPVSKSCKSPVFALIRTMGLPNHDCGSSVMLCENRTHTVALATDISLRWGHGLRRCKIVSFSDKMSIFSNCAISNHPNSYPCKVFACLPSIMLGSRSRNACALGLGTKASLPSEAPKDIDAFQASRDLSDDLEVW